MPDYLHTISRISNNAENKQIKVYNSILDIYYHFNKLSDNVNRQMKMKYDKPLILLGKFKINYDKNERFLKEIIFTSSEVSITIKGSFAKINDAIVYHKHREVFISVA
jgi:hypothetical protein